MKESAETVSSGLKKEVADRTERTLFALVDDRLMALPTQLLRDWTLAFCAVFVAMQFLPEASSTPESTPAAYQSAEVAHDRWRLVPARARQITDPRSKSGVAALSPMAQRHGASAGKIARELVELTPTEFAGFGDIPGDHWVVQLAAFDSMIPLKVMVQRYQLSGAIGATTLVNGKEVHVLLMDVYPSKAQAIEASRRLPPGMGQINPWVRSVNSIRKKLK